MAAEAPVQAQSGALLWRGVALLGLLVALVLWCERHLGILASDWGRLPIFAVVAVAWGVIARLASEAEQKAWQTRLRSVAERIVLEPRLLAGLYLLAALLFLMGSSLSVIVDDGKRALPFSVAPVDAGSAPVKGATRDGLGRVFVWTNPFGRAFRIEVQTYAPSVVTVYPLLGARVNASRDLRRAPTLLVRLPLAALSIQGEGSIDLLVSESSGAQPVRARYQANLQDLHGAKSFLFGPSGDLPLGLSETWRLQADATSASARERGDLLLGWQRSVWAAHEPLFRPGMQVSVEAVINQTLSMVGTTTIADDPVTDLLLASRL